MWRASGGSERERRGPSTSTRRERRSEPDRSAYLKDPASGRRRGMPLETLLLVIYVEVCVDTCVYVYVCMYVCM